MPAALAQLSSHFRAPVSVAAAVEAFVDHADLAATSRRVYGASLATFAAGVGAEMPLTGLDGATVAGWFTVRYHDVAPATWNRELATLRSAITWWVSQGWAAADPTAGLARRREHPDRTRALTRRQIESLWQRTDIGVREKTLWRLLYETAARAGEILGLDVTDLDLASKRARVRSKGGATEWVFWQTGAARLLPRLLAGRTAGPVFLAGRLPSRATPTLDLDPATGRARLSYRRAAALFAGHTGWTLHQLRHSALTHAAEDGTNLPLLLARSRHASIRSLERYARPGPEAVARSVAEADPARRRR
jgi:integrase/recombinase XerD